MIHRDSVVRWIDTTSGNGVQIDTIENLFSKFITKSVHIDDNTKVIYFHDDSLHIQINDITGYTPITSIVRLSISDSSWLQIVNVDNLVASPSCLIPTYDMNENSYLGFHGEVKRKYTLKMLNKIYGNDHIRIYDYQNKVDDYILPKIVNYSDQSEYGYVITTESRFCTVNGMHMFAADYVTVDEAKRTFP